MTMRISETICSHTKDPIVLNLCKALDNLDEYLGIYPDDDHLNEAANIIERAIRDVDTRRTDAMIMLSDLQEFLAFEGSTKAVNEKIDKVNEIKRRLKR